MALKIFYFQAQFNPVYKEYLQHLKVKPSSVQKVDDIPFLPIEFFKSHTVYCSEAPAQMTFTSSGTTGAQTSRHHIADLTLYQESYRRAFERFYGSIDAYCVLALLPSYLERQGSSLITMTDDLIRSSQHANSGFYLHDLADLRKQLLALEAQKQKTILLGVTYALLDLIEVDPLQLQHTVIMETGGMKGKRKEMIREELHATLQQGFGVSDIHSEYGMTELLSQAYSSGKGIFECPPWMQIKIRQVNDPFCLLPHETTGGINVIDLANLYSCSFIATQDLGKKYSDGTFEVLGRFDTSDTRGCNLLVQ